MKKLLFGISLVLGTILTQAQMMAPAVSTECEWFRIANQLPYYYCQCHETAEQFAFPYIKQISDTVWLETNVNDLKRGLSAYWFSNSSVTIELYAFCSSKVPSLTLTVGPNQMREMDVAKINQKLTEMGEVAELMAQALSPRLRVYPNNGGSGYVYGYPYDQGPRSTCGNTVPLLPRMTYVCDSTYEVYELAPERISSAGKGFIQWKQKKNNPCTITLRADSCNGQILGQRMLSDSMRVYVLEPDMLRSMKQANRAIYVEVQHGADQTGRIWYYNTITPLVTQVDTVICQGKYIELPDTIFYETTTYNDTLLIAQDTLSYSLFHLTVTPPDTISDTLRVKASKLPMIYRNQERIAKDSWGDHAFLIHTDGVCDEYVNLYVARVWDTQTVSVDTAICEGKSYKLESLTLTSDTMIQDSMWRDEDTWVVRNIHIQFTPPELEYDTIALFASQIEGEGYYYDQVNNMVTAFGDTLYVITGKNKCTRHVLLTVLEDEELITGMRSEYGHCGVQIVLRPDGVMYIRREDGCYTLMGQRIGD